MSAKATRRREDSNNSITTAKQWIFLGQQTSSAGSTPSPTSPTPPQQQQQSSSPPPYSASPPPAYLQCPSPPPLPSRPSPQGAEPLRLGPGQTRDPNWQATKGSVRERNAAMLRNELMSDVRFLVGPKGAAQSVPAHKYVLATGSSVFYAMFYGGLAAPPGQDIEIPDVEPAAFLVLLRYLYCDDIALEADTVLATLYAAKKYLVPHLARACVAYLETSLTARNACVLLSQSRLFEEPALARRCWEIIDAQAELALSSDGFPDVDRPTLEAVLSRESLNARESAVFRAALAWAAAECTRRGLDPSPENRRECLGPALHLLRLPAMSLQEFADGAAQSGVLTLRETADLFLHFAASRKPAVPFPSQPRAGLPARSCRRFQSCAYRSNQWRYRGRCDSVQFCADRRVFLAGFGLYGSSSGACEYRSRIELKRGGKALAHCDTRFHSDGSSSTFRVYFEHPVQIEADTYYTASAVLEGSELSYFGQEGMSEVTVGCVTFQFQSSSDSTNGTGVQGGQIPELVFYGSAESAEPA
ncbi:topoisomerase TOP1-interacting protein BTBD1, putative [Ixodes scapularis]|uniref:Topoisomerase TOP1-interacting protein BTBD1, putative n=1 Tax=Ixodes scapularis TaxID=6945 RepID=B7Q834_IXOSC|nr:topoisomerase TOP1-interacting protein BTBD1, putative [Ixodes scapularis]|eukprot:XP_002412273.1 topoisomerase TOP1-interacting protein BTBD1, putative [Ixodes scapularis]